jgi:hypothetical protein
VNINGCKNSLLIRHRQWKAFDASSATVCFVVGIVCFNSTVISSKINDSAAELDPFSLTFQINAK